MFPFTGHQRSWAFGPEMVIAPFMDSALPYSILDLSIIRLSYLVELSNPPLSQPSVRVHHYSHGVWRSLAVEIEIE